MVLVNYTLLPKPIWTLQSHEQDFEKLVDSPGILFTAVCDFSLGVLTTPNPNYGNIMSFSTSLSKIIKLNKFFESCMCRGIALFCVPMRSNRDLGIRIF